MYVGTSKMTSKGQVTVPLEIRRAERLNTGTSVVFIEADGEVVLAKSTEIKKLFSVFERRARELRLSPEKLLQEAREERKKSLKNYFS